MIAEIAVFVHKNREAIDTKHTRKLMKDDCQKYGLFADYEEMKHISYRTISYRTMQTTVLFVIMQTTVYKYVNGNG